MRTLLSIFLFLLFAASPLAPANAQQNPDATRIETDQHAGTITIVIDGHPTVVIDKTGLHVAGDLSYGGTISDSGPDQRELIEKTLESGK